MQTHLITGGTGKTGRRVATHLRDAGHEPRVASRHPEPGGVHFDWNNRDTWAPALQGADGVYLVGPAFQLDTADLIRDLLEQARGAGIQRAVLLSARGVDMDERSPGRQTELAAESAGVPLTILRPAWFAQNFTEGVFAPMPDGSVVVPAGQGASAFIDTEDIAAVAVAALTQDGHAGQAYDMSGPEAVTWADAVTILGAASGRQTRYVDADPGEWIRGAVAAGLPEDYAGMLAFLFGLVREGHDAYVSDGVQRAIGRQATPFARFAEREAGSLAAAGA